LPQTTINKAINDLPNVSTHAFQPMTDILSILYELGSRA